jgi:hypothetical protein
MTRNGAASKRYFDASIAAAATLQNGRKRARRRCLFVLVDERSQHHVPVVL